MRRSVVAAVLLLIASSSVGYAWQPTVDPAFPDETKTAVGKLECPPELIEVDDSENDALRWCRLAEQGDNTRSNHKLTLATRFWGNTKGGPDVGGGLFLGQAAAPLTKAGICNAPLSMDAPLANACAFSAIPCKSGSLGIDANCKPTACMTADRWASNGEQCIIPGKLAPKFPYTQSLEQVCDQKVITLDVVNMAAKSTTVQKVGIAYIFKDWEDNMYLTVSLNATFAPNDLEFDTREQMFVGQYLHFQPAAPSSAPAGSVWLWQTPPPTGNVSQLAAYTDQLKRDNQTTAPLWSCWTYKFNTNEVCNPLTAKSVPGTPRGPYQGACVANKPSPLGAAAALEQPLTIDMSDPVGANKAMLMKASFQLVKANMDPSCTSDVYNIDQLGEDITSAGTLLEGHAACGCLDLNTRSPTDILNSNRDADGEPWPASNIRASLVMTGADGKLTDLIDLNALDLPCSCASRIPPSPPPKASPHVVPPVAPSVPEYIWSSVFVTTKFHAFTQRDCETIRNWLQVPLFGRTDAINNTYCDVYNTRNVSAPGGVGAGTIAVRITFNNTSVRDHLYEYLAGQNTLIANAWSDLLGAEGLGLDYDVSLPLTTTGCDTFVAYYQSIGDGYHEDENGEIVSDQSDFTINFEDGKWLTVAPQDYAVEWFPELASSETLKNRTYNGVQYWPGTEAEGTSVTYILKYPTAPKVCPVVIPPTVTQPDTPLEFPPSPYILAIENIITSENGCATDNSNAGTVKLVGEASCPAFYTGVSKALQTIYQDSAVVYTNRLGTKPVQDTCGNVILTPKKDAVQRRAFLKIDKDSFSVLSSRSSFVLTEDFIQDAAILCDSKIIFYDTDVATGASPKVAATYSADNTPLLRADKGVCLTRLPDLPQPCDCEQQPEATTPCGCKSGNVASRKLLRA